jgi:hypothetical protein
MKDVEEKVTVLAERALDGHMRLSEFLEEWPEEAHNDEFLEVVFEDLESGVEHTPYKWSGEGVDYDRWLRDGLYMQIYLDLVLLRLDGSNQQRLLCRNDVMVYLRSKSLTKISIDEAVKRFWGVGRAGC